MKRFTIMILAAALLCGCSQSNDSSSASVTTEIQTEPTTEIQTEAETEPVTESETEPPTEPETAPPPVEVSPGITLIDLSIPANSGYLQYKDDDFNFIYGKSYEAEGYGTITEETSLWLTSDTGERTMLIESDEEHGYDWAEFCFMIDESRFCYERHGEWGVYASGIYDLSTGEDFAILKNDDDYAYVPEFASDGKILFSREKPFTHAGFSEMDIDSYQLRDLEFTPPENSSMMRDPVFSPDKKTAALLSARRTDGKEWEYIVILYSLEEEKTVREVSVFSQQLGNRSLNYISDSELYLFVNIPGEAYGEYLPYLYIFDIDELLGGN